MLSGLDASAAGRRTLGSFATSIAAFEIAAGLCSMWIRACAPGDRNMSDKSGSGSEHHESRRERVATDDSLREERGRADTELAKNRTTANQIADDVVRLARARADALVDGARIATDRATDARSGAHAITAET